MQVVRLCRTLPKDYPGIDEKTLRPLLKEAGELTAIFTGLPPDR